MSTTVFTTNPITANRLETDSLELYTNKSSYEINDTTIISIIASQLEYKDVRVSNKGGVIEVKFDKKNHPYYGDVNNVMIIPNPNKLSVYRYFIDGDVLQIILKCIAN